MSRQVYINATFRKLLDAAWGSQYGNIRIISTEGGTPSLSWHKAKELEQINQSEDTHAFWSTTAFDVPAKMAKKGLATYVGIVWVDIDDTTVDIDAITPVPNFVIRTSPEKAHLFYVLDEPVVSQSDYTPLESLQARLSLLLGGDRGSVDLGHISRVPGSLNAKNGHVVTIEEIQDVPYSLAELNPEALSAGQGRHQDAVGKLASAAAAGADIEAEMDKLERFDYTEPFDPAEREGLVEFAENSDVAKLAPDPVDGLNVERWVGDSKPMIKDYTHALEPLNIAENSMGGRIMMNGTVLDDGLFSTLHSHMEAKSFKVQLKLEHALKEAAFRNDSYNPVVAWIEQETWDKKDHIAHLAEFFADDSGDFEVFIRHWLVGSIAKLLEPLGAFNRMLVMEGNQGLGKSYFVQWLVPPALGEYFCEDIMDPEDKDTFIKSTEKWVWEVGELEGITNAKDQSRLKSFLSTKKVSVRKPYERFPMNENVRASYIGTLNDIAGFLRDTTGNRRYMAVSLFSIDWDYADKVNLKQLWAQALALYRNGFKWELSGEDEQRAMDANDSFMASSPLAERLTDLLRVDPDNIEVAMSTADIVKIINLYDREKHSPQEVSAALQHLGARRVRKRVEGKQVRLWIGVSPKEGVEA